MKEGPVRTCVGCRARRSQAQLIRVARHLDGSVGIDSGPASRAPGRGAYLCFDRACVERALGSGRLHRALKCEITRLDELRAELLTRIGRRTDGEAQGAPSS
ncbi:MAG: YlxR family protein [Actinomycetota bacterium]